MFHSGSKKEALQMLDLAVKKGVKSYIEMLPSKILFFLSLLRRTMANKHFTLVKEAGKALRNVKDNSVRYRHVLKYVFLLLFGMKLKRSDVLFSEWTSKAVLGHVLRHDSDRFGTRWNFLDGRVYIVISE
jgi:hypothetical protein